MSAGSSVIATHDTPARASGRPRERRRPRKIRFTNAEWALVAARARACGRPPAAYVRDVALGTVPRASRLRGNATLIRDLARVATELREVVRRTEQHDDGGIATVATSALSTTLDIVRRLG